MLPTSYPTSFFRRWDTQDPFPTYTTDTYIALEPLKKAYYLSEYLVDLLRLIDKPLMFTIFIRASEIFYPFPPKEFSCWNETPLPSPESTDQYTHPYTYENFKTRMTDHILSHFRELTDSQLQGIRDLVSEFFEFLIKVSSNLPISERRHVMNLFELYRKQENFKIPQEQLHTTFGTASVLPGPNTPDYQNFGIPVGRIETLPTPRDFPLDIKWRDQESLSQEYQSADREKKARMLASNVIFLVCGYHRLRTFGLWYQLYAEFQFNQPEQLSSRNWCDYNLTDDPFEFVDQELSAFLSEFPSSWSGDIKIIVRDYMTVTLMAAQSETNLSKTKLHKWHTELYNNVVGFTYEELVDPSKSNYASEELPRAISFSQPLRKKDKGPKIEIVRDESPKRK